MGEDWRGKRVGFLGGSFDPVHLGHLIIAQDALENAPLDKVFLVPASRNPLKADATKANARQRMEMARLATEGDDRLGALDIELSSEGPSYTVHTARRLAHAFAGAELFWIIGGDQVPQLPDWHRPEELCRLVRFIALCRPGHEKLDAPDLPGLRLQPVQGHLIEISATEIRRRRAENRSVSYFLPGSVCQYIDEQALYREPQPDTQP